MYHRRLLSLNITLKRHEVSTLTLAICLRILRHIMMVSGRNSGTASLQAVSTSRSKDWCTCTSCHVVRTEADEEHAPCNESETFRPYFNTFQRQPKLSEIREVGLLQQITWNELFSGGPSQHLRPDMKGSMYELQLAGNRSFSQAHQSPPFLLSFPLVWGFREIHINRVVKQSGCVWLPMVRPF